MKAPNYFGKIHPFIRNLLITALLLFIIFTIPWISKFGAYWSNVTSQDFANFGDYIGGVLNPMFTLGSALVIGFQIVRTTENQKLERLVKDYEKNLEALSLEVQKHGEDTIDCFGSKVMTYWREAVEYNAIKAKEDPSIRSGQIMPREDHEKWASFTRLFRYRRSLLFTLKQIQKIDKLQYEVSVNTIEAVLGWQTIDGMEVAEFFLGKPTTLEDLPPGTYFKYDQLCHPESNGAEKVRKIMLEVVADTKNWSEERRAERISRTQRALKGIFD